MCARFERREAHPIARAAGLAQDARALAALGAVAAADAQGITLARALGKGLQPRTVAMVAFGSRQPYEVSRRRRAPRSPAA